MFILVLLLVQYEPGMTVIMSDPPPIPSFNFSAVAFQEALDQVGGVATLHALMGGFLLAVSLLNLAMALRSGLRSI
jgi:hypothetical protein